MKATNLKVTKKGSFKQGDYITRTSKAYHPAMQTLKIDYFERGGAETTTAINSGCFVENLANYRLATASEIKKYNNMLMKATNR